MLGRKDVPKSKHMMFQKMRAILPLETKYFVDSGPYKA